MSRGTPTNSAENSSESRTRRSMDARGKLTSGCRRFVSRDGRRRGSVAQGVAEAVDSGLGVMDMLLDGLGALAVLRRKRGNIGQEFGIAEDGGQRIANLVGGAGGEAAEGGELLGMGHLLLYGIQILDGGLRQADGLDQLSRKEVQLPAGQGSEDKHGAENKAQAKCRDPGRNTLLGIAEQGDEGQGKNGQHGEACGPAHLLEFTAGPSILRGLQGRTEAGDVVDPKK